DFPSEEVVVTAPAAAALGIEPMAAPEIPEIDAAALPLVFEPALRDEPVLRDPPAESVRMERVTAPIERPTPERATVVADRTPAPRPMPIRPVPTPATALHPYPWGALAAVAVAGAVLSGVLFYRLGFTHGVAETAHLVAAVNQTPARTDTDVPVVPETPA